MWSVINLRSSKRTYFPLSNSSKILKPRGISKNQILKTILNISSGVFIPTNSLQILSISKEFIKLKTIDEGTWICIEQVDQSNVGLKSVTFVIRRISRIIMKRFSSKDILSKSIKIGCGSDISKKGEQN